MSLDIRLENKSTVVPMDLVRAATQECHNALERAIDWHAAFESLDSYRQLLCGFQKVVQPLERSLATWFFIDPPPDFIPHVRSQWLRDDLHVLDHLSTHSNSEGEPARSLYRPSSNCDDTHGAVQGPVVSLSFIESYAAAIGGYYVLEGSSLGGQILSRELHNRLGLSWDRGGRYFAAYQLQTMKRWKQFRSWANDRLLASGNCAATIDAAVQTFQLFQDTLAKGTE